MATPASAPAVIAEAPDRVRRISYGLIASPTSANADDGADHELSFLGALVANRLEHRAEMFRVLLLLIDCIDDDRREDRRFVTGHDAPNRDVIREDRPR